MKRILILALAQALVLASLTAPAVVGLSIDVRRLLPNGDEAGTLAAIISAGSIAALVANPLFGWLADATRRRRTLLVAGAAGGFAGCTALLWAPCIGMLTVAWISAQVGYNMCFGAINGLVSAQLAPADRTRAAGVLSAVTVLGALPGLAAAAVFANHRSLMVLAVPAAALVAIPLIASRLPGESASATRRSRLHVPIRTIATSAFGLAVAARFVIALELAAGLIFALYLFTDRWHLGTSAAVRLVSIATLLGAVGIVGGSCAISLTRLRVIAPRVLLGIGLGALALGTAARGLAPTPTVFLVATFIAGCAIGTGFTASRSLAQSALPAADSGLGLGVLNAANTLAPAIAPLLAGALVMPGIIPWQTDGYGAMYLLLTIPIALCAAAIPISRPRRSRSLVSAI
ncbi:MFS transporter [Microbacterium nanhaiense]|uniref:MFS transporter n=1 Tax=Microbacterium nanhaiense TaxID=1301026 RepID=A0ABQ2N230_9MICO|nr:MFS transporter [Microbacterium nanhaiense]GGO63338.1 MFS transporter [Microbacterium nanhaiense]